MAKSRVAVRGFGQNFLFGQERGIVAKRRPRRKATLETLERRSLLAAGLGLEATAAREIADVNGDGIVSPRDAIAVINAAKRDESGNVDMRFDLNGDRQVTAEDIHQVHDVLSGGESVVLGSRSDATGAPEATTLDSLGVMRVGDINGTHNRWLFDLDSAGGGAEADRLFGLSSHTFAVAGDWNGDGATDTGVVFEENGGLRWLLDTNGDSAPDPGLDFSFGLAGDIPVTGDWDSNGTTNVGVVRKSGGGNVWFLDTNYDPSVERGPFVFGLDSDIPVVGDWNDDGVETPGAVRPDGGFNRWFLTNDFNSTPDEPEFVFGLSTDIPVVGDWNGDGKADATALRDNGGLYDWYFDTDRDALGLPDLPTRTFGFSTDIPVVGKWEFSDVDTPGLQPSYTLGTGADGQPPSSISFDIRNTGNDDLQLSISAVPSGFLLSNLPSVLAPGQQVSPVVTLDGSVSEISSGRVIIQTSDGGESLIEFDVEEFFQTTPDSIGLMSLGGVGNGFNRWSFDLDSAGLSGEADRLYGLSTHQIAVTGDWDGNGSTDTGVVVQEGGFLRWMLDTNGDTIPEPELNFLFGLASDMPVTGDWNNDSKTDVGIARQSGGFLEWYLDTNRDPAAEIGPFTFGLANDQPVAGDWDRDGITTPGVVRDVGGFGTWYLTNDFGPTVDEPEFIFGLATDSPMTGDWNGDGRTDAGATRQTNGSLQWFFDTDRDPLGVVDLPVRTFGLAADLPVAGAWQFSEFNLATPSSITLPQHLEGQPAPTAEIVIENPGNVPLVLSSPVVPPGFLLSAVPDMVLPGQNATLTVTQNLSYGSFAQGTLTINTNDGGESPVLINLSQFSSGGDVNPVPADIAVTVSQGGALSFGEVRLGATRTEEIQIQNVGGGSLEITEISSSDPAVFIDDVDGTLVLTAFQAVSRTVTLDTSVLGTKSATITIRSNDPDVGEQVYTFTVTADVVSSASEMIVMDAGGEELADGSKLVFEVSSGGIVNPSQRDRFIKISNKGNENLLLSSVRLDSEQYFFVESYERRAILPNTSGYIHLRIRDITDGNQAELTIESNDSSRSPFKLTLEVDSNVQPTGTLSIDEYAGGRIRLPNAVETGVSESVITLRNSGDAPLHVASAIASGQVVVPSGQIPLDGIDLAPNDTFSLRVQADTSAQGERLGAVTINSDGGSITVPFIAEVIGFAVTDQFLVNVGGHYQGFSAWDIAKVTKYSNGTYDVTAALIGNQVGINSFGEEIDAITVVGDEYVISTTGSGWTAGNFTFQKNDLIAYNPRTDQWRMVYQERDFFTLFGNNIVGVAALDQDRFVIAVDGATGLFQNGDGSRADPNNLYVLNVKTGRIALYFDGHSRGLTTASNEIDAVDLNFGTTVSTNGFSTHGPGGQDFSFNQSGDAFSLDDSRTLVEGISYGIFSSFNSNLMGLHLIKSSVPPLVARASTRSDVDWSDAPASYGAASHVIGSTGPVLGVFADADQDAQFSFDARGDDSNLVYAGQPASTSPITGEFLSGGDEDGVIGLRDLEPGTTATFDVSVTNAAGFVQGWLDFNADGDWDDPGEAVVSTGSLTPGVHQLSISVPADAATGATFARFRISSDGGLPVNGDGGLGEVEDYQVFLGAAPQVESVHVNGGDAGRSLVTEVSVTFDSEVIVPDSAFMIANRSTGQVVDRIQVQRELFNGKTVATLTFSSDSEFVEDLASGKHSLRDGYYELLIDGELVTKASEGVRMGAGFVFGSEEADDFFRLFGDTDGDGDVDGQDYGRFGLTFLRSSGQDGFDERLDSDGDGDVDGQDYGRFGSRFLTSLVF